MRKTMNAFYLTRNYLCSSSNFFVLSINMKIDIFTVIFLSADLNFLMLQIILNITYWEKNCKYLSTSDALH